MAYGAITEESQESRYIMNTNANKRNARSNDASEVIGYSIAIGVPLLTGGLSFLLFRAYGRSKSGT